MNSCRAPRGRKIKSNISCRYLTFSVPRAHFTFSTHDVRIVFQKLDAPNFVLLTIFRERTIGVSHRCDLYPPVFSARDYFFERNPREEDRGLFLRTQYFSCVQKVRLGGGSSCFVRCHLSGNLARWQSPSITRTRGHGHMFEWRVLLQRRSEARLLLKHLSRRSSVAACKNWLVSSETPCFTKGLAKKNQTSLPRP